MAISELANSSINHFEYAQKVKESGIAQKVDDVIIAPLKEELSSLRETNGLTVKRGNMDFVIEPTMCEIRRFAVSDPTNNYLHEVIVKDDFIEVKIEDISGQNPKRHIWNCPEALEIVDSLLNVFNPQKTSSSQELLFQA